MITYVNTVLVSNLAGANVVTSKTNGIIGAVANHVSSDAGKYVIVNADTDAVLSSITDAVKRIKIGLITDKVVNAAGKEVPVIRWSNIIDRDDVKKIAVLDKADAKVTEDSVVVDFTDVEDYVYTNYWSKGGKRIIVRLTFKDLPTRYRKWTESYEYVTKVGDDAESIADAIAELITKQVKRARVIATSDDGVLTLEAMPYDDDNSVDSINRFEKNRFNVNVYWTDPDADGWASLNKNYPNGLTIEKVPGFQYAASGKLVRDRENAAFGYLGIINRGSGTWPIVQPGMNADITKNYSAVTLEFENMYHTADDLMRKTKQTVELYFLGNDTVATMLATFADKAYQPADEETEKQPA